MVKNEETLTVLSNSMAIMVVMWRSGVIMVMMTSQSHKILDKSNDTNLYIKYPDRKSYTSAPWGSFQIVINLFRS